MDEEVQMNKPIIIEERELLNIVKTSFYNLEGVVTKILYYNELKYPKSDISNKGKYHQLALDIINLQSKILYQINHL